MCDLKQNHFHSLNLKFSCKKSNVSVKISDYFVKTFYFVPFKQFNFHYFTFSIKNMIFFKKKQKQIILILNNFSHFGSLNGHLKLM